MEKPPLLNGFVELGALTGWKPARWRSSRVSGCSLSDVLLCLFGVGETPGFIDDISLTAPREVFVSIS